MKDSEIPGMQPKYETLKIHGIKPKYRLYSIGFSYWGEIQGNSGNTPYKL